MNIARRAILNTLKWVDDRKSPGRTMLRGPSVPIKLWFLPSGQVMTLPAPQGSPPRPRQRGHRGKQWWPVSTLPTPIWLSTNHRSWQLWKIMSCDKDFKVMVIGLVVTCMRGKDNGRSPIVGSFPANQKVRGVDPGSDHCWSVRERKKRMMRKMDLVRKITWGSATSSKSVTLSLTGGSLRIKLVSLIGRSLLVSSSCSVLVSSSRLILDLLRNLRWVRQTQADAVSNSTI